jgi:hypothetical protein
VFFFPVMKTLATILSAFGLMVSFSSCGWLKEKYAKNERASVAYLSEKKSAPARTNIEGVWYAPEWGIVVLNQERDGKLTGIFQEFYVVNGVVSGNSAFITLIDEHWVAYTVELKRKNRGELTGFYSSSVPFSEKDAREIVLKRIGD